MEKLMQYVWQHRLWLQQDMRTVDGRIVQVIDPGQLNTGAGPDFFNAKVKINGEIWVGNIEIHVRASDWMRHGHDKDPAYDSVILHVVGKDDIAVRRSNGETIPQLRMPCSPDFSSRYSELVGQAATELPCSTIISLLPEIYLTDWIATLAHERLYNKVDRINNLLQRNAGDWEETCYITLARCLGFGTNSDSFERLALSLPLRFMGKHSDSLLSIEALLFGQSGLLDNAPSDAPYVTRLITEYRFLAGKFSLRRPENLGWRMARMRPPNFPHRRIAMLATLIHGGFRLMSDIISATDETSASNLFRRKLTGYWATHYNFGPTRARQPLALSESSLSIILINTVIPLTYAYGVSRGDNTICDRATTMLQSLKPERNSIITLFDRAGIKCPDAFTSQALIQLRREYCEPRKCLYCRIGHRMLAAKVKP
ncbi:MAG: DUF2851 family protein [Muribaculaceae bacterium]|nr:DUF2851 family protein [Muribaculaceae bacterium]